MMALASLPSTTQRLTMLRALVTPQVPLSTKLPEEPNLTVLQLQTPRPIQI
jgi:hypothetical protein